MTPRPALHLPLNGSLAGTASNVAYTATGNGALRYRDADLGGRQCALVEEAGENLITTAVANWKTTIAKTSGDVPDAEWDVAVHTDTSGDRGITFRFPTTTKTSFTAAMSACIRSDDASIFSYLHTLLFRSFAAGNGLPNDRESSSKANITISPDWQRFSQAHTFIDNSAVPTAATFMNFWVATNTTSPVTCNFDVSDPQLEIADHASSFISGDLGTGYAWSGTPHASTSTRALTTIEADYDSTIEHIFCRYSEDFGETWATASLTSATTFGSYASFDLTANVLTIESSRALMVRDVAVYDVELLPVHQEQIIAAIEAGTFGAGRKPLFVPRGYPVVFVNVRK